MTHKKEHKNAQAGDGYGSKRLRLTHEVVRDLPAPAVREAIYTDSEIPGFQLTVSPKGKKRFRLLYTKTDDGVRRTYSLHIANWRDGSDQSPSKTGSTVAQARKLAEQARKEVDDGHNPAAKIKAEAVKHAQAARGARRLSAAVADYIEQAKRTMKPQSVKQAECSFRAHILPKLGQRYVTTLTRDEIEALALEVARPRIGKDGRKKGGPEAARHVVAHLSAFMSWAADENLVERNEVKRVRRTKVLGKPKPRQRYLTEAEWRALWELLDDWPYRAKRGSRYAPTKEVRLDKPQLDQLLSCEAIRIALLTGARKGEVYRMRWEHVDLDRAWWVKPETKNGDRHEIPLSALAVSSLRKVREAHADPEWVFPGRSRVIALRRGEAPKGGSHVTDVHELWGRLRNELGIPDVRHHDLRHTAASVLISSGATEYEVGAQLGHRSAAATRRYSHLHEGSKRQTVALQDAYAQKVLNTPPAGSR